MRRVAGYLAAQRIAQVAPLKFASGAVIGPLVRVWRSAAACTDLCEEVHLKQTRFSPG